MVGRLVEQEKIRLAGDGAAEEDAALKAAGKSGEFGERIELKAGDEILDAHVNLPVLLMAGDIATHPAGNEVMDVANEILRHLLHEAGEMGAGLAEDLAGIRLHVAGYQFHEGRFARTVAADQTHAFARIDLEIDVVENGSATEGVGEIEETE
jgi:hypothetical protein